MTFCLGLGKVEPRTSLVSAVNVCKLQSAVEFDQELICRKMQMAEYRHRERILSGRGNDELQEDHHLYMGMLMIARALLDHVTEHFHHEANFLKERRKMREERQASRGGGKGKHVGTIDKQANEIKKLKSEHGASTDRRSGRQSAKGFS